MSNAAETNLLKLLLQNIDWANVGDAAGLQNSATAGSVYVALHTADPGDADDQTTNEISYTGYARVAVARSAVGWTVVDANCSNAAAVTFGLCTVGTGTATHFSVGDSASGAGNWNLSGALVASLAISPGITPEFAIGELDINAA
jgi:hypothetical protein